jgi:hypothetical protein
MVEMGQEMLLLLLLLYSDFVTTHPPLFTEA